MKIQVNRKLAGGLYHVSFSVGSFTPEEVSKMGSFGVPLVALEWGGPPNRNHRDIPITQIAPQFEAKFSSEEEAKFYEEEVLAAVREGMNGLRERSDKFTSTDEVDI